jgi:hypothetical protein
MTIVAGGRPMDGQQAVSMIQNIPSSPALTRRLPVARNVSPAVQKREDPLRIIRMNAAALANGGLGCSHGMHFARRARAAALVINSDKGSAEE